MKPELITNPAYEHRYLEQQPQLVIVVIVSAFLHAAILFLLEIQPDTPLPQTPLINDTLRIHLLPRPDPVVVKEPERHEHTAVEDEAGPKTPEIPSMHAKPASSPGRHDPTKDKMKSKIKASAAERPTVIHEPDKTPKPHRKQQSAQQLITRSLDIIRSQELAETDPSPARTFGIPAPDWRLSLPESGDQTIIDSYRLPSGHIWVKVKSPLGGVQCFEVKAPDPANELSVGAWMFTRC